MVNLENIILPQKRQDKFFKNFEHFFEEHSRMINKNSLQNIFTKFYKNCFGEETFSQILDNPEWLSLDENQNLRMRIFKEDLVNFEDKSFDFLLEIDDYNARQGVPAPKKFYFNRMNFNIYFLQFFAVKSGFKRICQFLNGFISRMAYDLLKESETEGLSLSSKNHIPSDIFYSLFDLSFHGLKKLKSYQKHHKVLKLDKNFIPKTPHQNEIFLDNKNQEKVLIDEKNTFVEDSERRIFEATEIGFTSFYMSSLSDLAECGLRFFKNWKPIHAYGNQILKVVSLINYVEKVIEDLRKEKNGRQVVDELERRVVGKKIDEDYFLEIFIMIIKTYLKNPNYAQKMNVGNLLNTLEDYVSDL